MNTSTFTIRSLVQTDELFLWEMLYQALFVLPGTEPFPRDIIRQPEISRYVDGWGRMGDSGFIVVVEETQLPIGAAWIRLMTGDGKGYGYVDDQTPELTIAVAPDFRGHGIGGELMNRLLAQTQTIYRAVCLSVSADNPAFRLYQRLGFETIKADGSSLTMIKQFN